MRRTSRVLVATGAALVLLGIGLEVRQFARSFAEYSRVARCKEMELTRDACGPVAAYRSKGFASLALIIGVALGAGGLITRRPRKSDPESNDS